MGATQMHIIPNRAADLRCTHSWLGGHGVYMVARCVRVCGCLRRGDRRGQTASRRHGVRSPVCHARKKPTPKVRRVPRRWRDYPIYMGMAGRFELYSIMEIERSPHVCTVTAVRISIGLSSHVYGLRL
jgi:hypothetical protein